MSLKRNIFWLQLLQVSTIAIPLVTQPWIARVLGPNGYGQFNFVMALTAYLVLLADFGFSWSATRALAVCREDLTQRSQLVCTTFAAKGLLAAAALALLLLVALVSETVKGLLPLLLLAYLGVLGAVLAPVWYFQATEQPHVTSSIDLSLRLLSVPMILLLVRTPEDLPVTVALTSGTQLLIGIAGFTALARKGGIIWRAPARSAIAAQLRSALPLFASTSAISLYTTTSSVIVGIIAKHEQLAYFSAAQKIVNAAGSIFLPINQALYPRVSNRFHHDFGEGAQLVRTALYVQAALGIAISGGLFVLSDWLVLLLFGEQYGEAAFVLRCMSVIPLLLGCAGVFANLILLPLGHDARHLRMVIGAALTNLVLIVPLVHALGAAGGGLAVSAAEAFVVCYSGLHAFKLLRSARHGGWSK